MTAHLPVKTQSPAQSLDNKVLISRSKFVYESDSFYLFEAPSSSQIPWIYFQPTDNFVKVILWGN